MILWYNYDIHDMILRLPSGWVKQSWQIDPLEEEGYDNDRNSNKYDYITASKMWGQQSMAMAQEWARLPQSLARKTRKCGNISHWPCCPHEGSRFCFTTFDRVSPPPGVGNEESKGLHRSGLLPECAGVWAVSETPRKAHKEHPKKKLVN